MIAKGILIKPHKDASKYQIITDLLPDLFPTGKKAANHVSDSKSRSGVTIEDLHEENRDAFAPGGYSVQVIAPGERDHAQLVVNATTLRGAKALLQGILPDGYTIKATRNRKKQS